MADTDEPSPFEKALKRLSGQPRGISEVVVARAALRTFPVVSLELSSSGETEVALPTIRAMALPLIAAKYQKEAHALREIASRAASDALLAVGGSLVTPPQATAAAYNAVLLAGAGDTDFFGAPGFGPDIATATRKALESARSVTATYFLSSDDRENVDRSGEELAENEIAADTDLVSTRGISALVGAPLWQVPEPSWLRTYWRSFRSRLLDADEEWDVWTRWYDAVRKGQPTPGGEELDIYRVSLPEEDWKRGAAHVNALIRKKEEDITARAGNEEIVEIGNPTSKAGTAISITGSMPPIVAEFKGEVFRYSYFISYSTKDEDYARWIGGLLEANGKSVFVQYKDVRPGHNFVRQMMDGIEHSANVIALLSPDYEKSDQCLAEWAAAYSKDPSGRARYIRPFKVRSVQLNKLAQQVVYTDLVGLSGDEAARAVLQSLDISPGPESASPVWPAINQSFGSQSEIAAHFEINEHGRVDVQLAAGADKVSRNQDIVDGHGEVLRYAFCLLSRQETLPKRPNHSDSDCCKEVILLKEGLGDTLDKIRPGLLIPRGEALRQRLQRQLRQEELID